MQSQPCSTSSSLTWRSSPPTTARRSPVPYRSQFITPPATLLSYPAPSLALQSARLPLPYPAGRPNPTSAPCPPRARRLVSMHPAAGETPHHQPQRQRTSKPTSREVGKLESWKVGEHTTIPCRLPPADNGDSTMQGLHSAITAQCSHTARARL